MRFVNYCIPFLFTICTVSQLFWNRVCITLVKLPYRKYFVFAMFLWTAHQMHVHVVTTIRGNKMSKTTAAVSL